MFRQLTASQWPSTKVVALTHQFAKDDCALAKAAKEDVDLILGGQGTQGTQGTQVGFLWEFSSKKKRSRQETSNIL